MDVGCFECFMRENRERCNFIKLQLMSQYTFSICQDTIELGSKLKGKFMLEHNSPVLRHKFKIALKETSQHFLLCRYISPALSLKNFKIVSRQLFLYVTTKH